MAAYLVTGGAGFIGSHLVDRLLQEGQSVRILDNFSTGKRTNAALFAAHKNFELVEGDLWSFHIVRSAMRDNSAVMIKFAKMMTHQQIPIIYG